MKTAFGVLEFLVVIFVLAGLFFALNSTLHDSFFPTKNEINRIDTQKQIIDDQIKDIQRLKQEHDKTLKDIQ